MAIIAGGEAIKITGLKEVQRTLYAYSQQLGDKVVLGALRKGAQLIRRAAIANLDSTTKIKTGRLRKGFRIIKSKQFRGTFSGDMIGVYLTIAKKKKDDPYYGRFLEDGWSPHGVRIGPRSAIRAAFGSRTGRKTQPGNPKIDGRHFIENAWNEKRESAVNLIVQSATAAADLLAKKLNL